MAAFPANCGESTRQTARSYVIGSGYAYPLPERTQPSASHATTTPIASAPPLTGSMQMTIDGRDYWYPVEGSTRLPNIKLKPPLQDDFWPAFRWWFWSSFAAVDAVVIPAVLIGWLIWR